MGYTHYYPSNVKCSLADWEQILADLRRVIDQAGIPLGNADGEGLPSIGGNEICFNGADRDSHEAFQLVHTPYGMDEACKTARKPYDAIVCCALMIVRHYVPKFEVLSDGDAEDWEDAVALCRRVLHYGVYPCAGAVDTPDAVVKAVHGPTTVQPVDEVIEIHRTVITELGGGIPK